MKSAMSFYFAIRFDVCFIVSDRMRIATESCESRLVDCEQIENSQFLFDNKRSIKIYETSDDFVAMSDLNSDIDFYQFKQK